MIAARRLPVSDAELAVIAEALRGALAAELLSPGSRTAARELLDRVDAKLPSALQQHPAGASTGRLLAGDEILRLLLAREDRHGWAALSNEEIARELSWKPPGTSVRELLEELRRAAWLTGRGSGYERRFELTRKGRGRARELAHAAPDAEARVSEPDELLDLIYADSTPCAVTFSGDGSQRIPGLWHRPTVQAAARLSTSRLCELEVALRDAGIVGESIHSYGTLTVVGERRAREHWDPAVHGRSAARRDSRDRTAARARSSRAHRIALARTAPRTPPGWHAGARSAGSSCSAAARQTSLVRAAVCSGRSTSSPPTRTERSIRSPTRGSVARAGATAVAGCTATNSRLPTTTRC